MKMLDLDAITLQCGPHESFEQGACVMELVSYLAGEVWSDHPECVSPVIANFCRRWNDDLEEVERNQLLKPLVQRLIGTRTNEEQEVRRSWMVADWLLRSYLPTWLRLAGLTDEATLLSSLPEGDSYQVVTSGYQALSSVRTRFNDMAPQLRTPSRQSSWDAVTNALCRGAGAAAWTSVQYANPMVLASVEVKPGLTWLLAKEATLLAVKDATSLTAVVDRLGSTLKSLQLSAVELLIRLCTLAPE